MRIYDTHNTIIITLNTNTIFSNNHFAIQISFTTSGTGVIIPSYSRQGILPRAQTFAHEDGDLCHSTIPKLRQEGMSIFMVVC